MAVQGRGREIKQPHHHHRVKPQRYVTCERPKDKFRKIEFGKLRKLTSVGTTLAHDVRGTRHSPHTRTRVRRVPRRKIRTTLKDSTRLANVVQTCVKSCRCGIAGSGTRGRRQTNDKKMTQFLRARKKTSHWKHGGVTPKPTNTLERNSSASA